MVASRDGRAGAPMVPARRAVLRVAGSFATAAILMPRLAAGQAFTATSISQAAQQARRDVGELARRADDLLRLTVADGAERGASAVRRFRAGRASLGRDLAAIFNGRVSEDDWLLIVPTRELELVLRMQPLVIRLAPTLQEVEVWLKQPLPQIEPRSGDDAEAVLLTIVLAALGMQRNIALIERLREDSALAAALRSAAAAVKAKNYGLAAMEIERLMRVIVQPRVIATIAEQHGAEFQRTLYKALVVSFVPFVGWTFFDTLLLAAIYDNRDTTAPVLR